MRKILELSRREYERSQMETQRKSVSDNRTSFVNLTQQMTNENVIDLVSSAVTKKTPADVLFNGTADEPIYINDPQGKDFKSGRDLLELPKRDNDAVDILGGTVALGCKRTLEAAESNEGLQNRKSADASSDENHFNRGETQKRRAPMINSPERKRKRTGLSELESDEDYARYLQEAFNKEARQSNLMKDDEELARKLAEKENLDDDFSREADNKPNLIEEDEKLARKLSEEGNYKYNVLDEDFRKETDDGRSRKKGDEELARKIAEEDNLPRYSILRNETRDSPVMDEDAVLAMQLNEQLNKESPKQIARILPTIQSGRTLTTAFAPEWTEYSKRKPSATYTPMSANNISFENQVSMEKNYLPFSQK